MGNVQCWCAQPNSEATKLNISAPCGASCCQTFASIFGEIALGMGTKYEEKSEPYQISNRCGPALPLRLCLAPDAEIRCAGQGSSFPESMTVGAWNAWRGGSKQVATL